MLYFIMKQHTNSRTFRAHLTSPHILLIFKCCINTDKRHRKLPETTMTLGLPITDTLQPLPVPQNYTRTHTQTHTPLPSPLFRDKGPERHNDEFYYSPTHLLSAPKSPEPHSDKCISHLSPNKLSPSLRYFYQVQERLFLLRVCQCLGRMELEQEFFILQRLNNSRLIAN